MDSKKEYVVNGNNETSHGVDLNEVTLKESGEKPKTTTTSDSRLLMFLKLLVMVICGALFGIALEKGRGEYLKMWSLRTSDVGATFAQSP